MNNSKQFLSASISAKVAFGFVEPLNPPSSISKNLKQQL